MRPSTRAVRVQLTKEAGGIPIGNEHEPVIDDLAGGLLAIGGEGVGVGGAVEEFIAEEVAVGIEDGLAAEKSGWGGAVRRRGFLCCAAGFRMAEERLRTCSFRDRRRGSILRAVQ